MTSCSLWICLWRPRAIDWGALQQRGTSSKSSNVSPTVLLCNYRGFKPISPFLPNVQKWTWKNKGKSLWKYSQSMFDEIFFKCVLEITAGYLTNKEALTVFCSIMWSTQEEASAVICAEETWDVVECVLLECSGRGFLSTLQRYNRSEHRQSFFICFLIKNPLISPRISLKFLKQTIGRWRGSFSSVFYTLIKHEFSTNQSARYTWILSIERNNLGTETLFLKDGILGTRLNC